MDDGLWAVDGEWLALNDANRRHARIGRMWHIPAGDILLHTTVDRDVASRVLQHMTRALADLRRVFGTEPSPPLHVTILRDEEQYDLLAFGDTDGRRPATHAGRLHVAHTGFFAESWYARIDRRTQFNGMGVGYWNALVPHGDVYGVHSARLAVGLSFVDALDPSPKAVRRAIARGRDAGYYDAYAAEKKLPAWLCYGGAVYAERYFEDDAVAPDGESFWARNWSLENLRSLGGLRPLDELFAFALDPDQRADGLKLLIEAGLVTAFLVDGPSEAVQAQHAALKRSLRSGGLHKNQVAALEQTLRAHDAQLRAFAGL